MNTKTETTTRRPLSIATIKRRNHHAGFCFFSPSSMRYWSSTVYTPTRQTASGKCTLFVTSETAFPGEPNTTRYTVRQFDHETCDIHTMSQFQEFDALADAVAAMTNWAHKL